MGTRSLISRYSNLGNFENTRSFTDHKGGLWSRKKDRSDDFFPRLKASYLP